MKDITKMELNIYRPKLLKQWWDGQFSEVSFTMGSANKIAAAFDDAELHQEIHNLLYRGEDCIGILSSFRILKDEVLVHYPFFRYLPFFRSHALPPKHSDLSTMPLTLYKDCRGYGAHIENGKLICYHPLMLPPFQDQIGYCIGALRQSELIFPQQKNIVTKCSLATIEQLCTNVNWRQLIRFAKPYNDYFAAANVKKVPSKNVYYPGFWTSTTVPLYIGDRCVAVKLWDNIHISYEEYLEKFM